MAIDSNELLGRALGTCTLKRLIGRGGMGAVYLAQQSRPRRTVAVKVVLPGIVLEQKPRVEFLARFRREADAIAALDHINIMPIYEYGEQGDTAYLVMPYVTGGTLRDVLEKRGTLSLKEVVPILEQIAAGLDSAHAQSIVHRDLKPGNILFHADGRVLLADFGLAKVLKDVTENESNGHLTSIGTIIGTPEYLSPEQGTGDAIDYHTDIYSLGVVVYQMLAGRVPFAGTSPVAIAIKHALEEPPPPSRFNPSIPKNVEAVVMKAIAKKPAQRYGSAGAFARAFRQAVAETQQESPDESVSQRATTSSIVPVDGIREQQKQVVELPSGDEAPTETGQKTPTTKEQDATMATVLMKDTPSDAQTEEPVHLAPQQQERVQAVPNFAAYSDATVADAPLPAQLATQPQISELPTPATTKRSPEDPPSTEQPGRAQNETPAKSVQSAQHQAMGSTSNLPTPSKRIRSSKSLWMIIAGSALVLILVGGGLATYVLNQPTHSPDRVQRAPTPGVIVTPTGINTHATPNSTPQATPTANNSNSTQLPGPMAGVAGIGSQIYGTVRPGKGCDTRGGQWSSSDNAKLVCGQDTLELTNTSSQGNQLVGTFLNRLPGNQSMPASYVVQTQATLKSGSQSPFGIAFYDQPGSTSYAFIIDPSTNTWTANYYNKGQIQPMHTQSLQTRIEGTVTIDVVVAGNNYYLYINGTQQGSANSAYGNTSGNPGLVVGPGADVAFKNTILYTNS